MPGKKDLLTTANVAQLELNRMEMPLSSMPKQARMSPPRLLLLESELKYRMPSSEPEMEAALWWFEAEHQTAGDFMQNQLSQAVSGCLTEFFRLYEAEDDDILRFAKKWGVLGIWPRRYKECPLPLRQRFLLGQYDRRFEPAFLAGDGFTWLSETTSFWRSTALHFRTLLTIGAKMQSQNSNHLRRVERGVAVLWH